jgi:hypothetical protein
MNLLNKQTPVIAMVPAAMIAVGLFLATIGSQRVWIPIVLSVAILFSVCNNWRLTRMKKTHDEQRKPAA